MAVVVYWCAPGAMLYRKARSGEPKAYTFVNRWHKRCAPRRLHLCCAARLVAESRIPKVYSFAKLDSRWPNGRRTGFIAHRTNNLKIWKWTKITGKSHAPQPRKRATRLQDLSCLLSLFIIKVTYFDKICNMNKNDVIDNDIDKIVKHAVQSYIKLTYHWAKIIL